MARLIKGIETKLVHAGEPEPRIGGAVSTPIFQSSTFETGGAKGYHDLRYIRLSNTPNHDVLHQRLAALENAEAALVTASGMAAISTTLLTVLAPRGHLLAQNCLYGGTHDLLTQDFPELGIEVDFIDGDDPASWREMVRDNTRAIYVETISNPLLAGFRSRSRGIVRASKRPGLDDRQYLREPAQLQTRGARLRSLAA